jgi:HlyD family secretion protein
LAGIVVFTVGLPVLAAVIRGERKVPVETVAVTNQIVRSSVLASGTIGFRDQVQLRSEVSGKVQAVNMREGDRVQRGEVLIALDAEQYRMSLQQQRAQVRIQTIAIQRQEVLLENLERRVERQKEIFRQGLLDRNAFETTESEMQIARLSLHSQREALAQSLAARAQAQDSLARAEIRSPIDGIVTRLNVKPGEAVITGTINIPGTQLAEVVDPSVIIAEVKVDETDIGRVGIGQRAAIHAAAFPDLAFDGTVERIAAAADRAEGQQNLSFLVEIQLEGDAARIKPGISCRAEIYTASSENELAVPLQAVRYDEALEREPQQPYLFVVANGTAVRRTVTLGLSSDSHVVIRSGLTPDDRVVAGPLRTLRMLRDGDALQELSPSQSSGADK